MVDNNQNLVPYMNRFTPNEKAVICNILNNHSLVYKDIHLGTLPFARAPFVMTHIASFVEGPGKNSKCERLCRQILGKMMDVLEKTTWHEKQHAVSFVMKLNTAKVFRHFGRRPELGKPLSILPKQKVTVGVKWSLPKKSWVPDRDNLVTPCVILKRRDQRGPNNIWEVTVQAKCKYAVEHWLLENCS